MLEHQGAPPRGADVLVGRSMSEGRSEQLRLILPQWEWWGAGQDGEEGQESVGSGAVAWSPRSSDVSL